MRPGVHPARRSEHNHRRCKEEPVPADHRNHPIEGTSAWPGRRRGASGHACRTGGRERDYVTPPAAESQESSPSRLAARSQCMGSQCMGSCMGSGLNLQLKSGDGLADSQALRCRAGVTLAVGPGPPPFCAARITSRRAGRGQPNRPRGWPYRTRRGRGAGREGWW